MIAVVGPPVTRSSARDAARQELSKAVYHRNDDPWPIRLFHWLGDWMSRITDDVTRHAPGGGAGAVALLVLIVALALVARWRLGPLQRTRRRLSDVVDVQRPTTAEDHRARAETAATSGRWDEAVVERMRAVARELEERGVLDARPGRTADELAAEVARERPDVATSLREAVTTFDGVVYGGRAANRTSYDAVVAADDAATVQAGGDTEVLVVDPSSVPVVDLSRLARTAGTVVAISAEQRELTALGVDASASGAAFDSTPAPGCTDPVAAVAGDVTYSGVTYQSSSPGAVRDTACYRDGSHSGLLLHDTRTGQVVVFGSASTFANDHLAKRGNAALGIGLLARRPTLVWVLPKPPTVAPNDEQHKGLLDLLPDRLLWAVLALGLAVLVLAVWRGRRLGPVVAEPLPVVVRAVETVEGRARLLRAARARGEAGQTLRAATVARLRELLSLGGEAARAAVVEAAATRTGRSATDVDALLYGADPGDDAALVALAGALDELEASVRNS